MSDLKTDWLFLQLKNIYIKKKKKSLSENRIRQKCLKCLGAFIPTVVCGAIKINYIRLGSVLEAVISNLSETDQISIISITGSRPKK